MAKNKKQKLGNVSNFQTEFASETNVDNNTVNKAAQKNANQANQSNR